MDNHPLIASAAFKADPYPFYEAMRKTQPVRQIQLSRKERVFLVSRYADVSALLRDPRLVKNPANALTPAQLRRMRQPPKMFLPLMRNMLGQDDPDHARLKRLVQSAFTPRRVAALANQARSISADLLHKLKGREKFDLIADYALPLPVTVISDLLGVPKADQARFARWSHALIKNSTPSLSFILSLPNILGFLRYLRQLIARKRAEPKDDLVSALVAAEEEGTKLDSDELLAMVAILLSAGHETTTNLIGNGMLSLLQHPSERERLKESPQIIESAVEELLRYASPVEMSTHRFAKEDMEIAGVTIPRGSLVMGVIASANRDEQQFDNPNRLDLGRSRNRHLTFGEGGHYCVGAALARLEGKVAFTDLVETFPKLRLSRDAAALRWRPGLVLRSLKSLPVTTT